jgi:hypothetical protein
MKNGHQAFIDHTCGDPRCTDPKHMEIEPFYARKPTPRAQRRSKALIVLAWLVTLVVCIGNALASATPTSGPAWADLGISILASFVTWLLVKGDVN